MQRLINRNISGRLEPFSYNTEWGKIPNTQNKTSKKKKKDKAHQFVNERGEAALDDLLNPK